MDNVENQFARSSAIPRPPTRMPVPSFHGATSGAGGVLKGLQELSNSQSNARAGIPTQVTTKRGIAELSQQPERKTLVARAAEPLPKQDIPTVAPTVRSNVKATSLAKAVTRQLPQPTGIRQTTATNFSSTVGPGSRPPARPQTSMAFNSSVTGRPRAKTASRTRPTTALGYREDDYQDEPQGRGIAWDLNERIEKMDSRFNDLHSVMNDTLNERRLYEEMSQTMKARVKELEEAKERLEDKNVSLQSDLNGARQELHDLKAQLENEQRSHQYSLEDAQRHHRIEIDELRRELAEETRRLEREYREKLEAVERHHRVEVQDEQSRKDREIQELRSRMVGEQQDLHLQLQRKDREIQNMRSQLEDVKGDLDREHTLKLGFQKQVAELQTANMSLEDRIRMLKSQIEYLESDSKAQSDTFSAMEARLQEALRVADEARQKLIKEETERRILFNKYQELKGNIRVMCRVRPVSEAEAEPAKIQFPDAKTSAEIEILGPEEKSSLGNVTRKTNLFEFDRVFAPNVQNSEVFDEISQLVQSALDGYNVCIFCYGQTGSGKTYTMSSADGMIPRATHMIYDTITRLKEKSWNYTMEGSFIEVYNEELHDLLSSNNSSSGGAPAKKLEIRHDEQRKQTTVLNCRTVALDSPDKVETMLRQAAANRSVAATKANERSSRSHSVFMLRLVGENSATGERCEGTLNLVDLAGSERLKQSGAEGDRMKEAQNINRSLACLGDVIEALGRGSPHIPYRNSKLTHLLQYSLGGNSKTLMFVMVSPLEMHLKETLTSLRFATKVHNTHIGTAKATKKIKERVSES